MVKKTEEIDLTREEKEEGYTSPEAKRNIYALSSAAFFNDTGSDMLTPAYSTFITGLLSGLRYPQLIIGLLEALSRLFGALIGPLSGKVSDRKASRKIFIWVGYILLMISRGTQALAQLWHHLIGPKILYEFGRGIRTPAREAMITEDIPDKKRGWAFGLLQTADSTGAILGPTLGYLLWSIFIYNFGWSFNITTRVLIGIAAAPTILSVLIVLIFVKNLGAKKKDVSVSTISRTEQDVNNEHSNNDSMNQSKKGEFPNKRAFYFIIILVVILFLGIPTEALLLTMPQDRYNYSGDTMFILFFFFNVFYALAAYPAGIASDKFGSRTVFSISTCFLILFGVLSAANRNGSLVFTISTLIIFGIFRGSIFPPTMKMVAKVIPKNRRAEMMGTFSMYRTGSEIASPFILGGLFDISPSTQFLPYVLIAALGVISVIMVLFAPKIIR